ncbi:ATP-binding protein [Coralloluteibacterium stylophorae]|uniref:histidine kinase n=2 Tax=Coralloluteibacterium stylophorae TaxID=1776034 RepID=A0AAP2FWF6_9GAMM|nr:ATP-binding protein [Coralloluteibacterium stylophorae]MBS7455762.1 HAMP domain-containing histidine kinase [Coralloluteibacterium stylophorae]
MSARPLTFLHVLCDLRWIAVAGQSATVLAVVHLLGVPLDEAPLWGGIAVLAAFNLYARWRAARVTEATSLEILGHVAVDVLVLAWLVAWSGGVGNPFSSLFLLPLALVTLALPPPWAWATAVLCIGGYVASALLGRPLPHVHGVDGTTYDLHLWGMAANFGVSAGLMLYFFTQLADALRRREQELARLREQFARNEGIVALATHAASVAHELNTPLGTLTLMLDEHLERALPEDVLEDTRAMRGLVDVCRDRVRDLVRASDPDRADVDLEQLIARWQLVRPTIELHREGPQAAATTVDAGIGHLLQALLNNAADASERAGATRVDLLLQLDDRGLRGEVRDYGSGFALAEPFLPGRLFRSTKPHGMGVGLALSHATVERLGGELAMEPADGRGVRVRFSIPAGVRPVAP